MSVVSFARGLVTLAVVALAAPLAAQNSGSITGKVTDSVSGKPIAAAHVIARSSAGGGFATTADAGTYRIQNLPAGSYTVTVTHIGNAPTTMTVTVGSGAATADFVMPQINMLNQVTVTDTRGASAQKVLDAPASISVVGEREIAIRPSLTTTDHLKETPGVDISQGGLVQSNVVARGFNNIFSGSMLMLQDYRFAGVPSLRVNVPFLFTGTNEDIERIEVLLGPASALYGPNSANGVLHVITKSPFASPGTSFTLDGGSHSILRVSGRHASLIGDRLGFKLSGEYMRGVDFKYEDPAEPETFPAFAPPGRAGTPNVRDFDVSRATGEARLDIRPDGRTEAVTTIGFTKDIQGIELTGANGAAIAKNWTYMNIQERVRRGRFFAQAFMNLSNAGNDNGTDLEGTYLLRSGQPIVDKSRVYVGQVQHGLTWKKADLVYGADYIFTNPRTSNTINGMNEDIDNVTEYGGYVQGTIALKPKWDFIGALRLDKHSEITGSQFSPRAALVFKPAENQNFRVAYNRAFSTPANFSYFLDLISAPNLGGSGFDLRAVGNHGGHTYDRSCEGAGFGSFCMNSIYTGGSGPASAGAAFGGLITAQQSALTAAITNGLIPRLIAAGVPASQAPTVAGQLANAIVGNLKNAQPTNAQLATHAATIINTSTLLSPNDVQDIGALKAGYNNNVEFGYKGLIGKTGRLAVDVWYQQRGEINPPAYIATPSIFTDSASLNGYLTPSVEAIANGALQQAGYSAQQAQFFAQQIAAGVAPLLAGNLARAPLGTVTFDGETRPDILATYASFSGKTIDVYGVDLAYDWMVTPKFTLAGTYSWLSDNVFEGFDGGNGLPYMSNSPKHHASLALRYNNSDRGWGAEVRGRYADAFPVNSGVYYSDKPIHTDVFNPATPTYTYDPVSVIATMDLGVNWQIPISGQDLMWSLIGTNIFDNKRATFVGTPKLGRLIMTRLTYKF